MFANCLTLLAWTCACVSVCPTDFSFVCEIISQTALYITMYVLVPTVTDTINRFFFFLSVLDLFSFLLLTHTQTRDTHQCAFLPVRQLICFSCISLQCWHTKCNCVSMCTLLCVVYWYLSVPHMWECMYVCVCVWCARACVFARVFSALLSGPFVRAEMYYQLLN